jgi:hypothetical protein
VLLSGCVDGADLREAVAAQRRVTSANNPGRAVKLVADGEYAAAEVMVQGGASMLRVLVRTKQVEPGEARQSR